MEKFMPQMEYNNATVIVLKFNIEINYLSFALFYLSDYYYMIPLFTFPHNPFYRRNVYHVKHFERNERNSNIISGRRISLAAFSLSLSLSLFDRSIHNLWTNETIRFTRMKHTHCLYTHSQNRKREREPCLAAPQTI